MFCIVGVFIWRLWQVIKFLQVERDTVYQRIRKHDPAINISGIMDGDPARLHDYFMNAKKITEAIAALMRAEANVDWQMPPQLSSMRAYGLRKRRSTQ